MTYSPPAILKTCLFFATKTEHVRFSVAKFAEAIGKTTPEDVLASEFLLTQGLRFTFDVRHPFRALKGAIMELRTLAEGNTPVFPGANSEVSRPPLTLEDPKYHIDGLDRKAGEILMTSALLTDVYFHYTPSQIMLAALLSVDEELTTWYMNAKLSFSPQLLEKVMQTLRSCAAMLAGVQPASQPSEAEMKELKALAKKLNKCRNPEKMDLVAMNRRAKRDPEDEDDRAAKKRRLEREKVEKEADELFGPRLLKNNGQHA
jgi:cyclin H